MVPRQQTPAQVGFTTYWLFFLLHSFTQDFWQKPRGIVLFWLAVGLQRYYARAAMLVASATVGTLASAPQALDANAEQTSQWYPTL